jgi:hypothetical protein
MLPKRHTRESWNPTRTMPRCYSSLAGSITSKAVDSTAKNLRLSIWRSLSTRVSFGTYNLIVRD